MKRKNLIRKQKFQNKGEIDDGRKVIRIKKLQKVW